jgi:hypothetical protein
MKKPLPTGKQDKKKVIDRHVTFKPINGRKPKDPQEALSENIQVSLKPKEYNELMARCRVETSDTNVTVTASALGRKAILKYLQEANAKMKL